MIVAIDYDDTFTRDPAAWTAVIKIMQGFGHTVIGCTVRTPLQMNDTAFLNICNQVYMSSGIGKRTFLRLYDILPHVWIDDNPEWVNTNFRNYSDETNYQTFEDTVTKLMKESKII